MTELNQIYKCNICGNIVQMLHTGKGTLVCCGQLMQLQEEKIKDGGQEKHVPIIEKTKDTIKVKVGKIAHPMESEHYIEWVELIADGKSYRKFLKPGDTPEVEFCLKADNIRAREYCNLHSLWKSS